MIRALISASLLILSSLSAPPEYVTANKLSEEVLLLKAAKGFWRTNSVVVETSEGLVVIDTFPSPKIAREALAHIKNFSDKPVRHVINTHCHADHAFGNEVFAGATITGHSKCPDELSVETVRILEGVKSASERLKNQLQTTEPGSDREQKTNDMLEFLEHMEALVTGNFKPTPPSQVFEGDKTLNLGGKTFKLIYTGPVHSKALIAVHVPEDSLLITSCLIQPNYLPELDAASGVDAATFSKILGNLIKTCSGVRHVVPGHEDVSSLVELEKQLDYLIELSNEVKKAREKGLTQEQASVEIKLERFRTYKNYNVLHIENLKEEWKSQELKGKM